MYSEMLDQDRKRNRSHLRHQHKILLFLVPHRDLCLTKTKHGATHCRYKTCQEMRPTYQFEGRMKNLHLPGLLLVPDAPGLEMEHQNLPCLNSTNIPAAMETQRL